MAKSEQPFDQFIKEKLDSYIPPVQPDWDLMHHKIEEAVSDLEFDQKIREIAEQTRVDSSHIGWDAFVEKRNQQLSSRNKIITARLIETCLVLFMLWTIHNIGISHIMNPRINESANTNPVAAIINEKSHIAPKPSSQSHHTPIVDHQTENTDGGNKQGFDRKKSFRTVSLDENKLHKKIRKPNQIEPRHLEQQLAQADDGNEFLSKLANFPDDIASTSEMNELNPVALNLVEPAKLEELPIQELVVKNPLLKLEYNTTATLQAIIPKSVRSSVILNVHTGFMTNVVISPAFLEEKTTKDYIQVKPGFQTYLGIGFQSEKIMLESGIIYQHLSYEPNQNELVYIASKDNRKIGYYFLEFNKLNSQLLSIPILIHFPIIRGSNWTLTSKAGLSLTAALKNSFQVDTTGTYFYTKENQPIWDDTPIAEPKLNARVNNSSTRGILQGGDFGINSYSNFIAGLRYQQRLKTNLNFYTEIELIKMLGSFGFGPNGDRFISGNINAGLSFKL